MIDIDTERAVTLLRATYALLKQQDNSPYVLNILEQIISYDEVDCDGYCLMEDIEDFLFDNIT